MSENKVPASTDVKPTGVKRKCLKPKEPTAWWDAREALLAHMLEAHNVSNPLHAVIYAVFNDNCASCKLLAQRSMMG